MRFISTHSRRHESGRFFIFFPALLLLLGASSILSQQQQFSLTKKELERHVKKGRQLYLRGAYRQSFDEYRVVLQNTRGGGPDFRFPGLLFGLSDLGRKYAPARQALVERRDEMQAQVLAGKEGFDLVGLVEMVNSDILGEPEQNIQLYDELVKRGPEFAEPRTRLINMIWRQLLAAGRYREVRERTAQSDELVIGAPGLLVADFRLAPDEGLSSAESFSPLFADAGYRFDRERPTWYPFPVRFSDPDLNGRYKYISSAYGGQVLYLPGSKLYPALDFEGRLSQSYLPTMWVANTGQKKVRAVEWEYNFYEDKDGQRVLKSNRKKSKVNLEAGRFQLLFMTEGIDQKLWDKAQGARVRRVEYADGSVWEADNLDGKSGS